MKLVQSIMTNNPCYAINKDPSKTTAEKRVFYEAYHKNGPMGLMLHSVGCAQPRATVFINQWNKSSYTSSCVQALIDAIDGTVYQLLPWGFMGWHGGKPVNYTHIGVEMCEPAEIKYKNGAIVSVSDYTAARAAAQRTYDAAVELFAMLCKEFNLNPLKDGVILSHKEGAGRGIATNHGDPEHLWIALGLPYSMDTFRKAVYEKMEENDDMTEEKVREIVAEVLRGAGTEAPAWAKSELAEAIELGITDGSRAQGYASRTEVALMVKRAVKGEKPLKYIAEKIKAMLEGKS